MSLHMVHQPHDLAEFMRRPNKRPKLVTSKKKAERKFYTKNARPLVHAHAPTPDLSWHVSPETTRYKKNAAPEAIYHRMTPDGRYVQHTIRHYYHPKTKQHVVLTTLGSRYMQDVKTFKNQKQAHEHLKKHGVVKPLTINARRK